MAMSLVCRSALSLSKSTKQSVLNVTSIEYQQVRHRMNNKHKDPKFRNLRRLKVMTSVPLPKLKPFLVKGERIDPNYWQSMPQQYRIWNERDIYISTTSQVIEPFVPPEDVTAVSSVVGKGKELGRTVADTGKDKLAVRKIRQFEREFNLKLFADEAKDIYIKAHECLAANDQEKLHEYVTEMARSAMLINTKQRSVRWKFLQSLEPSRVVHVRVVKLDGDDDTFAQITLRIHSQQMLAVYDRFGRLMYGSEILAKDVLEYVVFEKHISNEYGLWRIHAKIIPDCLIRPAEHTYVKPKEDEDLSSSEAPVEAVVVENPNMKGSLIQR